MLNSFWCNGLIIIIEIGGGSLGKPKIHFCSFSLGLLKVVIYINFFDFDGVVVLFDGTISTFTSHVIALHPFKLFVIPPRGNLIYNCCHSIELLFQIIDDCLVALSFSADPFIIAAACLQLIPKFFYDAVFEPHLNLTSRYLLLADFLEMLLFAQQCFDDDFHLLFDFFKAGIFRKWGSFQ